MTRDLYDVAREVCHAHGLPWTDPRTRETFQPPTEPPEFQLHDYVEKTGGDYTFEGEIIMLGRKRSGVWRYAVENPQGLVHIFNGKQLKAKT